MLPRLICRAKPAKLQTQKFLKKSNVQYANRPLFRQMNNPHSLILARSSLNLLRSYSTPTFTYKPKTSAPLLPSDEIADSLSQQLRKELKSDKKDPKTCISIVTNMISKGQSISESELKEVIQAIYHSGQSDQLIESFREQLREHKLYTSGLFCLELQELQRIGKPTQGTILYYSTLEREKFPHSHQLITLLINMHTNSHSATPVQASRLFDHLLANPQIRPLINTKTFNSLLQVWADYGPVESADAGMEKYFALMSTPKSPQNGHKSWTPNVRTYEIMLEGLYSLKLTEKYYSEALAKTQGSETLHRTLIKKLLAKGQLESAQKVYEGLLASPYKSQVSTDTCALMIRAFAHLGQIQQAQKVFQDIKTLKLQPNSLLFSVLIDLCAKGGDFAGANRIILEDLPRAGIEPDRDIFASLIRFYVMSGELQKAEGALAEQKLRFIIPKPTAYTPLICAYLKMSAEKNNPDADMYYRKAMEHWHEANQKGKPTLYLLAWILGFVKEEAQLDNIIKNINKYIFGLHSLPVLIKQIALNEAIPPERTLYLYQKITTITGFKNLTHHYTDLVTSQARNQKWRTAIDISLECVDLAIFAIRQQLLGPLFFTKGNVQEHTRASIFRITYEHSQKFVEDVVNPLGLEKPNSKFIDKPKDDKWNQAEIMEWRNYLVKCKQEIEDS